MNSSLHGIGMTSRRTRERLVQRLREEGVRDERVLKVIASTPRHMFVDEALASRAYEDTALPIGFHQTISQPFIVARMTELMLSNGTPEKVLEVGTGSGYQTAILAQLVRTVCSLERIRALIRPARERLQALGLRNVRLVHGDGYSGLPGSAPYGGIVVTAAPTTIPDPLLRQLEEGGCLVAPVGAGAGQRLVLVKRVGERFEQEYYDAVSFVPLVGGRD